MVLQKKEKKRKTSSRSRPCELDKGCSLLEINCGLLTYKGVTNYFDLVEVST